MLVGGIDVQESDLGGGMKLFYSGERPPVEEVRKMVFVLESDPSLDAVGVGVPVTDAVKRVDGDRVVEAVDRSKLVTLGVPTVMRVDREIRSIALL